LLDGKMRIVKAFPPREVQTSPERERSELKTGLSQPNKGELEN